MNNTKPDPSLIDGKYLIAGKVGKGTSSDVFCVNHPSGPLALKLLRKSILQSQQAATLEDFKHEFSLLKDLNHPNIARILDFGYDATLNRHYFTTELIDGTNIFDATAEKNVMAILELMVQALRALEYIHSRHIFHFDLKAANLLVTQKSPSTVKMIDFGLASMEPAEKMIGTPSYMAPEIINREHPDGRADLYALGVLFYLCLTRENPFRGAGIQETLKNHQMLEPPPPSKFNKKIPSYLDRILLRLLEKNPANRYQRAWDALRDINRHTGNQFPTETGETLLSYIPHEGQFIGRLEEQILLKELFQETLRKEDGFKIALILGKKGSGKTRLLREMKYHSQLQQIPVLWGTVTEPSSFSHFLEALETEPKSSPQPRLFILDNLEGLEETDEKTKKLIGIISTLFYLRSASPQAPLLILLGAETNFQKTSVWKLLEGFIGKEILLKPFSKKDFEEYLITFTGLKKPPPLLTEGLYKRTGGNPLFVTEVLKSLVLQGALF
ncbi:MAG: serine/threonine-protein kinase, partial [bacterium]|nr:serine/threonine-protein kinase [bacterium]